MATDTIHLKLKINFPVILSLVGLVHLILMLMNGLPGFTLAQFLPKDDAPTTLKIRRVKTAKAEHPLIRPMESVMDAGGSKPKGENVTLRDLSIAGGKPETQKMARPGTRPEVMAKSPKAMNTISLKSKEFKDYGKSFSGGGLSLSKMISDTQKINDAVVSIEVPDGIEPDELNEYELMFYGFQKRTALNYINSILKNLDKFQKKYPNYKLPSTGRMTMTARVTYDPQGNVMQIKMIRWTHVNEMQSLFEDIVKGIDQLHNPPKALWEKNGEFSMFYTLEILNG
jgi:hypothetical protein